MPRKKIPLVTLFGYASMDIPRFSPDGSKFTFLAPDKDTPPTLWLADSPNGPAKRVLADHPHPLNNYRWAHTGKHLLFLRDNEGDENWHLYVYNIVTGETSNLISRTQVRVQSYYISPKEPNTVIIIMNMRDRSLYEAYSYNLITKSLSIAARNDGTIKSWHVDTNLKIRAKVAYNGSGSFYLYIRANHRSRWQHCHTWLPDDAFTSGPLFFSDNNKYLYITDAASTNTNSLQSINTVTGECKQLMHDEHYDMYSGTNLSDLISSQLPYPSKFFSKDGNLSSFSYYREKLTWHFFPDNKPVTPLQKILADPNWQQWIADNTDPNNLIIGRCTRTLPTTYWRFNVPSARLTPLIETKPELNKYRLTSAQHISFTARDGIPLNAYLSLPADIPNPPMVIKVHGGPWARDIGTFEPSVQFLTNRGYGCLQINFRGSTGYGKNLTNAGNKEWGGRMIDDLADAAQWLCKNNLATPKKIAIMGRSYGGFAALCASWRYNDLFSCAIAEVAPTHLPQIIDSLPLHWRPFLSNFHTRLGHPVKDKKMLRQFSPALNTEKMSLPLLISHGKNDCRVPYQQVTVLLSKLKLTKAPLTTLCFDNEGHRSRCQENILRYFQAVEQFLAQHLPTK